MKSIRLFVIVAVSVLALVMVSTPAQAYSKVYHGSDYGFTWATRDDHIMVCDEEEDGHGVWVDYYTNDARMHTMVDGNGSQATCAIANVYPKYISSYRVCERYVSCTAWKGTDGPLGN